MYAVIEAAGRQWKVEPGTRLEINRVATAVGAAHAVERVLLAQDGRQLQIGRPYVAGAKVVCEVLAHRLGPKVISYHYRRRENWRKTVGHRQPLTQLLVKEILVPGQATPTTAVASTPATASASMSPTLPTKKRSSVKPARKQIGTVSRVAGPSQTKTALPTR